MVQEAVEPQALLVLQIIGEFLVAHLLLVVQEIMAQVQVAVLLVTRGEMELAVVVVEEILELEIMAVMGEMV